LTRVFIHISHSPQRTVGEKSTRGFLTFFPKRLGTTVRLNFTCLLYVPIYAKLQIFIQLSVTVTKLCRIKREHPVHIICSKMSTIGRNARRVVAP